MVKDNNFDRNKAQILYQIISSQPRLLGFTFINYAQGIDYKSNEYANFEDNMKPFKKLPLITDLRWFREVVRAWYEYSYLIILTLSILVSSI